MTRLNEIEPEEADSFTRKLYKRVGMVPNLYIIMANSPMVFDGFLKLNSCLEGAKLDKKTREMVYLLTSQIDRCDYCLASHTQSATEHGVMTVAETLDARRARSDDPKLDAMLKFAQEVIEKRGHASDEALARVKEAGYSDEEIIDAVGTVALATLSNYVCSVGEPELDYLDAPPLGE
jgi:uncharacterized peroxidase-related enzyme